MTSFIFTLLSGLFVLLIYFRVIPLDKDPARNERQYAQLKLPFLVGGLALVILSITYLF